MAAGASSSTFEAPIHRIGVRPGRRPLDAGHVANLQVSFGEIGQRNAITLNPVADDDPQRGQFAYWLNEGGHRLAAAAGLGWKRIDAILRDDDALTARIAEVDENLIRRDLNALERAQAIAGRLEAWGARYPDRIVVDDDGHSHARKPGRPKNRGTAPLFMGFAAETSKASTVSIDTIKRALAIYRGIPAGLQAQLLGTPIAANPGLLRQLAALGDRDEQARVAAVLLSGQTKNLSDALAIAAGNTPSNRLQTPVDDTLKAFRKVWGAASPSARAAILHDLAGRSLPGGYSVTGPAHG